MSADPLTGVALRLANGEQIDWDRAATDIPATERPVLEELRTLEAVARFHQTITAAESPVHDSIRSSGPEIGDTPVRWGALEIRDKIGRGAFGDVYRAWDPRLGREVALKLLRHQDTQPEADIIREGHMLARVHHPNVVTIYGAERIDGRAGLWMELVRGETLEEELKRRGVFDPAELYQVAFELCAAVRAVHAAGLLHRDIKAQNVIRADDGGLVLMDFGTGAEPATSTAQTALAGTPMYLAPELLAGGSPSEASDVYALGVLLFHLATNAFPASATDVPSLRRAHRERAFRSVRSVRDGFPPAFADVIDRAVAADRGARFSTIAALQQALSIAQSNLSLPGDGRSPDRGGAAGLSIGARSPAGSAHAGRSAGALGRPIVAALIAGAVLIASVMALTWRWRLPAASSTLPSIKFVVNPNPLESFTALAAAPDGSAIVYGSDQGLQLRRLTATSAQPLPGVIGAYDPFWSADATQLAYFSERDLRVLDVATGSTRLLCAARRAVGGTWSQNGTIVFAADLGGTLYSVNVNSGSPVAIRRIDPGRGQMALRWPQFLPDGERFIYFIRSYDPNVQGIYLGSVADATGASDRRLMAAESNSEFSAGHIVTVKSGTLTATPFDTRSGALTGETRRVADHVEQQPYADGYARFSTSRNGLLVYQGGRNPNRELRWFDRQGRRAGTVGLPDEHRDFELSHDDTRVAVVTLDPRSGTQDVWIHDLRRASVMRLTRDESHDGAPLWSPDDERIAYGTTRQGRVAVYERLASGVGDERLVFTGPGIPFHWSPDGERIAFQMFTPKGLTDLVFVPLSPAGRPDVFVASPSMEGEPQFSRDGKWLAYSSSESGSRQIFVEPIPRTGKRWQISSEIGREPRWRGDGREIFFLGDQNTLMSVSLTAGHGTVTAGAPAPLFKMRITDRDVRFHYAVRSDGSRFLVNTLIEDARGAPLNVWTNWLN